MFNNLFKILIVSTVAISFNATTTQTHSVNQLQKVVDNDMRKQYYVSCKAEKRKHCHFDSFTKALVLRIK